MMLIGYVIASESGANRMEIRNCLNVLSIASKPAPIYLNVYSFTGQYYALMSLAMEVSIFFKIIFCVEKKSFCAERFEFVLKRETHKCYNREPPGPNRSGMITITAYFFSWIPFKVIKLIDGQNVSNYVLILVTDIKVDIIKKTLIVLAPLRERIERTSEF
ncbi:hypothetical protein BpHYR1_008415 [Brachionus plicatilis]|uniref:Uncharacterized protein n=1 Tax=Brachionus plicatilis TaxID=10195 RepID=A0A3M7SB91_BRAPC|nr:hypothetical protein BpHYR1_008415 [Brachionus plicatilis]